jgi:hypothetical protein
MSQQTQPNERHYAVLRLEEAERDIKQACEEMPALRQKVDKYKDTNREKAKEVYSYLQRHHRHLLDALNRCRLSLLEMELADYAVYAGKLSDAVSGFPLMTPDYSKLTATLKGFCEKIPQQTTNASVIASLMNNVKLGYYPTCLDHIKLITQGIAFPPGVITNVFDPCCGCGLALRTLAQGNNCYTYGIELDEHRAEEAQRRLHRVGFGSYFHSRISHEAFHVMLLNPPYLSVIGEGGNSTRLEKRFLVDSIFHLMIGGLLVYIVPYYRLTPDVCRILSENFSGLTAWKFGGGEFKKYKQIAVLGWRVARANGGCDRGTMDVCAELSKHALFPDKIPALSDLPADRYTIPNTPVTVTTFKGAVFNEAELAEQLKKSKSFSRLFEKSQLDSTDKRPLLPLNIGQVGLIGGSGLINGLIECDTPHVIKGRIVKELHSNESEETNSRGELKRTTVTETVVNRMIFNLLTPQGFKSLT